MGPRSFFLVSVAAAAALALAPAQGGSAADGESPEYEFRRPVLNGMGVSALSELRGKPVLIEFWGTR